MTFSPDGDHLICIGGDDKFQISVWDSLSGLLLARLRRNGQRALLPTSHLIRFEDSIAVIHDCFSGKDIRLRGHDARLMSFCYTPNTGNMIATASEDGIIRLWETSTGTQLGLCAEPGSVITSMAISPDEKLIAVGLRDGIVRVRNIATDAVISVLTDHNGPVESMAFGPAATETLVALAGGNIHVWNVRECASIARFACPDIKGVLENGTYGSVPLGGEGQVRIYDSANNPGVAMAWFPEYGQWRSRAGRAIYACLKDNDLFIVTLEGRRVEGKIYFH